MNESARANVSELGCRHRVQIVDFDQGDPSKATRALHDRCVTPGIQGGEDGRFGVVGGRDAASSDVNGLVGLNKASNLSGSPVVIARDKRASRIVELKLRVSERSDDKTV